MTPAEFDEHVDAYEIETRRWDERFAWVIGQLLAPHTKHGRPIPIERLLKPRKEERRSFDELDNMLGTSEEEEKVKREGKVLELREARKRLREQGRM